MPADRVSPHITLAEYSCACCHAVPPDFWKNDRPTPAYLYLFEKFEFMRHARGDKPIRVQSGYRCRNHNAEVGGEEFSVHLFGLALDLGFDTPEDIKSFAEDVDALQKGLRMGVYKWGVHIDVGFLIYPRPFVEFSQGVRW
ncbi:MAG: hypothetical protein IMZ62_16070 [Chloroflexi bacterium]|nr:hypothetical protein [Chloroflexota bacterium]